MHDNTKPRKPHYGPNGEYIKPDSMYAGPDMPDLAPGKVLTNSANPLSQQVGGGHYKDLAIQPVEYIHANNLPYIEGAIIKYVTRWRVKGGVEDLRKIIHFTELLIELEGK